MKPEPSERQSTNKSVKKTYSFKSTNLMKFQIAIDWKMKLRLFVGFIALISIAFCAKSPKPQASGPAPAQCPKSSVEVKPMKPELTGSVGFYGTGKGISDSLQKTPDSKSYEVRGGFLVPLSS